MAIFFGQINKKILSESSKSYLIFRRNKVNTKKCIENHGPKPSYIILRATKEDHYEILKLMRRTYFLEEPASYSLGLRENAVLDESAMKAMAEGLTMIARCKYNGCLVGSCINESTNPWDPDLKEKLACSVECPKVKQLLLFYAHVQREPNLWNCFGVQKIFEASYLFVAKEHRQQGIARRLLDSSRALAADCGYHLFRCDATSDFTAKICEKLGMKKAGEIPYCSYIGQNMEPVFRPPPPHLSAKIYIDHNPQIKKTVKKHKK